jgi:hypothetical protein
MKLLEETIKELKGRRSRTTCAAVNLRVDLRVDELHTRRQPAADRLSGMAAVGRDRPDRHMDEVRDSVQPAARFSAESG